MEPFSLRHRKALIDRQITVSLTRELMERLWKTIQRYNSSSFERTETGCNYFTDSLERAERRLKELLGVSRLTAKTSEGVMEGIEAYCTRGYPSNAFDVIEQFFEGLEENSRGPFQRDINAAMLAFDCAWRMSDGTFFLVDGQFFAELLESVRRQFRDHGFKGAQDELREAQEALADNRAKDSIQAAAKSVESTLKTILNASTGTAAELLGEFQEAGYLDDVPEDRATAIQKGLLMAPAVLRNKLAGHGQGSEVVTVPRSYAALAVNLAAAVNSFLIEQKLAREAPPAAEPKGAEGDISDDDIPF